MSVADHEPPETRSYLPRARRARGSRREMAERNRSLIAFDEAAHLDLARIRFWNQEIYLVNREDMIHAILVERAEDFRKGPLLTHNARPLLGNGLLISDNDLNRRQRRIVSPPFAHRKIVSYAGPVVEETERRIDGWRDGETLDIPQEMLAITLAIIGRLMFGAEGGETGGDAAKIVGDALPVLMNFAIDQHRAPLRALLAVPRAGAALIALNRLLNRRIRSRQRADSPNGGESSTKAAEDETVLLDALLFGTGGGDTPMTPRLVRDEAMTLFLAGLETVALAVAWSLHLLSEDTEACARVRAEATALGGPPTYDDLPRLPYTRQVLLEAMRLYPPAYIIARQAIRDVSLPGGETLPRGATVFVSAYVRHRRPDLFPDPLRFVPARWESPDFERRLPRYAYLPFGGGPHVCIGGHFAMMEAHLMLTCLARRVAFAAVPGQVVVPEPLFTLRPRFGLYLTVQHTTKIN